MTIPPTTLPQALLGRPLVVVDVEGNGGQPPRIVEIAVLPVDDRPVTGRDLRTWLVRPAEPITVHARRVHGIADEDVEGRPLWHGVAGEVAPLLEGRTLLAHNATTEYRVLGAHLPTWRPPMVLDTLRLARHVWPGLPGYGLDKLTAHAVLDTADVAGRRPHRAGYDTWCVWQLFRALLADSGLDWHGLVRAAALKDFLPADEPEEGLW
ncbi:3'-5' exonuclease [Saccharothrix longispora]|uniref:DNA polymerase III epsilon subunit-like protein n=1 Tax=Saccharothrix longispora TaxID=33920 RepID=A0ABU1PPY0_9PSEU|nr:3'-5' exonuclease [Saccharothrix longispora]MDR6592288.1 DNA polymerase III epsilon subunit-like protein [Saccharothrix longispora]